MQNRHLPPLESQAAKDSVPRSSTCSCGTFQSITAGRTPPLIFKSPSSTRFKLSQTLPQTTIVPGSRNQSKTKDMLARRPNLAHFTNCIFPQFTCEFHSGTPNWPEGCYRNRASLLVTHSVGLDQSGASEPLSFHPEKLRHTFQF